MTLICLVAFTLIQENHGNFLQVYLGLTMSCWGLIVCLNVNLFRKLLNNTHPEQGTWATFKKTACIKTSTLSGDIYIEAKRSLTKQCRK